MTIWIPVDSADKSQAKIASLIDNTHWILLDFIDGIIEDATVYVDRNQSKNSIADFVILKSRYENSIEFINEGSMVLCVREEEYIDEIIEAFKFKELDEVGL